MNRLLLFAAACAVLALAVTAAEFQLQQELNERIDDFVEMAIEEEMARELDELEMEFRGGRGGGGGGGRGGKGGDGGRGGKGGDGGRDGGDRDDDKGRHTSDQDYEGFKVI